MLQDHRVDLPVTGDLLPDPGHGGLAQVPALPGRPLPAVLQGGDPGHVHVRLRAVADPAAGEGGPGARGAAARHLQLAHRGRPRRAGAGARPVPRPRQAQAPGAGRAVWHAHADAGRRRQPAGHLPDHAHGRRRARGGRDHLHLDPAGAGRHEQLEPVRDRAVPAVVPAHGLQEHARGPEAPVPRRRLEHDRAAGEHVQAEPEAGGQPVAVPDGLCARGPLRRAGHRREPLPQLPGPQRVAARARHAAPGVLACLAVFVSP